MKMAVKNTIVAKMNEIIPNPNQPRRVFSAEELEKLKQTISKNGLMDSLWVVPLAAKDIPKNVKFEGSQKWLLIDGERRWRALTDLGIETVTVVEIGNTYTDAFHKGIIKHKTLEQHSDVEKARGIVSDIDNHLSSLPGFDKLENGTVTLINYIHNRANGTNAPQGLAAEDIIRMEAAAQEVCSSAGYTIDSVRVEMLPMLKLKSDMEASVGTVVETDEQKRNRLEEKARLEEEAKKVEEELDSAASKKAAAEAENKILEQSRRAQAAKKRRLVQKLADVLDPGEKAYIEGQAAAVKSREESLRAERDAAKNREKTISKVQKEKSTTKLVLDAKVKQLEQPKGWAIPTSTLMRLNTIKEETYRMPALEFTKTKQLDAKSAQKLAKIVNSGNSEVINSVLGGKITIEQADRIVGPSPDAELPTMTPVDDGNKNGKIQTISHQDVEMAIQSSSVDSSDPHQKRLDDCIRVRNKITGITIQNIDDMPHETLVQVLEQLTCVRDHSNDLIERAIRRTIVEPKQTTHTAAAAKMQTGAGASAPAQPSPNANVLV